MWEVVNSEYLAWRDLNCTHEATHHQRFHLKPRSGELSNFCFLLLSSYTNFTDRQQGDRRGSAAGDSDAGGVKPEHGPCPESLWHSRRRSEQWWELPLRAARREDKRGAGGKGGRYFFYWSREKWARSSGNAGAWRSADSLFRRLRSSEWERQQQRRGVGAEQRSEDEETEASEKHQAEGWGGVAWRRRFWQESNGPPGLSCLWQEFPVHPRLHEAHKNTQAGEWVHDGAPESLADGPQQTPRVRYLRQGVYQPELATDPFKDAHGEQGLQMPRLWEVLHPKGAPDCAQEDPLRWEAVQLREVRAAVLHPRPSQSTHGAFLRAETSRLWHLWQSLLPEATVCSTQGRARGREHWVTATSTDTPM